MTNIREQIGWLRDNSNHGCLGGYSEIADTMEKMLDVVESIADIVNDSNGVVGFHLNGEVAEWDEFDLPEVLATLESDEK